MSLEKIEARDAAAELMPCPFCGKRPDLNDYTDKPVGAWVLSHKEGECIVRLVANFPTKDRALAAWNRRSTPADSARAGELEKALREIGRLTANGLGRDALVSKIVQRALSAAPTPTQEGREGRSSSASLPAHVACATATEAPHSDGGQR